MNFIIAFVIGGFILSDISERNTKNYGARYPYEYVSYGDILDTVCGQTYAFYNLNTEDKTVAVISLSSYKKITKNNILLSKDEILYISQYEAERFKPMEGKRELTLFEGEDVIGQPKSYKIKDSSWEFVIGENIAPQLENIIVIHDSEFEKIQGKYREYIWVGNKDKCISGENIHTWNRSEAIKTEERNNNYILILMYAVGIVLMLEGQGIILIKQIANRASIINRYGLLHMLGAGRKEIRKSFFEEIKSVAFVPTIGGFAVGGLFLLLDCLYQGGVSQDVIGYYLLLCGIALIVQYLGYVCITLLLVRVYRMGYLPARSYEVK